MSTATLPPHQEPRRSSLRSTRRRAPNGEHRKIMLAVWRHNSSNGNSKSNSSSSSSSNDDNDNDYDNNNNNQISSLAQKGH